MVKRFLVVDVYTYDGKSDDYVKNTMLKSMAYSKSEVTQISGFSRTKTYKECLLPIDDETSVPLEIAEASKEFAKAHNAYEEWLMTEDLAAVYRKFSMCDRIGFAFLIKGSVTPANLGVCYTDGSASLRRRVGGWGICVLKRPFGNQESHLDSITQTQKAYDAYSGVCEGGTNNVGELTGLKQAVLRSDGNRFQVIVSDSEYAISVFRDWLSGWKTREMRTASGKPVANADLILDIDNAMRKSGKTFFLKWTKGHSDEAYDGKPVDEFNVICDKLAGSATAETK